MSGGVCGISRIEMSFVEFNMEYTAEVANMLDVAKKTSDYVLFAVALPFLAAGELVLKNGLYLLYNSAVCVVNGASWIGSKVSTAFSSIFDLAWISAFFGGPAALKLISTAFSSEDLITFRSALKMATSSERHVDVSFQEFEYSLWYDETDGTVKIQDRNRQPNSTLSLKIAEGGQVLSIKLDGVDQAAFPADFDACMYSCFMKSLEVSSLYVLDGNQLNIKVIRRGLREIPEYHLAQVGEELNGARGNPNLSVQFLTDQVERDEGIDAGGPRRDWLDDLFSGLVLNKGELRFDSHPETNLKMPVTQSVYQNGNLPSLPIHEKDLYEKIGALMMLCFGSRGELLIGKRFEDALFKAALSLTPQEVDTPFENLQPKTILKMAKNIMQAREGSVAVIELLEKDQLTQQEWNDAAAIASQFPGWPENYRLDLEQGDDPNAVVVFNHQNLEHHAVVRNVLRSYLYDYLGKNLGPIHAIAKGISDAKRRWHMGNQAIQWRDFTDAVQGKISGADVANSLEIGQNGRVTAHIRQKVEWIKEWLRDPQTPQDEIREFVKFATGSSSLAIGRKIRINEQNVQPYVPAAVGHSCFNTIDLSPVACTYGEYNDRNKENFIRALRELSLTQAGNYFMG